jgi:hypothetical protein
VCFDSATTSQEPWLDAKLLLRNSPAQGLHSNYYSLSSSGSLQQLLLDTAHIAHLTLNLGGWTLQKYSDDGFHKFWRPLYWLLIISRLRSAMLYPSFNFLWQKIQKQDWPSARVYDATQGSRATPYGVRFCNHTSIWSLLQDWWLDHLPTSWQFKYYWRLLQEVLEDAKELLEEASRLLKLLLSTTTCSRAYRAYTSGTHTTKDEGGLLLEFPCNPTKTHSV